MEKRIKQLLKKNVVKVIEKQSLIKKLKSGKKLNIKFGIDPTGPNLHLGHMVPIRKLREFQELGHKIIIIAGNFTAKIGDPSGRDKMREPLTDEQIESNLKLFKKQIGILLDLNKVEIKYNSEWLSKINFSEIIKLSSNFTVQRMIERDLFQKRLKNKMPIGLHEFLYPLMQGYDSYAIKADVEIGGTDQTFNLLIGRDIQKFYGQSPQDIITLKLLLGTDGRKMSKTFGNFIPVLSNPFDMYGKVMSCKDELIIHYFEIATDIDEKEIKEMEQNLKTNNVNPKDLKSKLAFEITKMFYGIKKAIKAEKEFEKVFRKKEIPDDIKEKKLDIKKGKLTELLVKLKLATSKSEAKRLILQGGVKINKKVFKDWKKEVKLKSGDIVQVGKRKFLKIK